MKTNWMTSTDSIAIESSEFRQGVCDKLKVYDDTLIKCMKEIQSMLDAKMDKRSIGELKDYMQQLIDKLPTALANTKLPKPLAAGIAVKIFNGVNCLSCGCDCFQTATDVVQHNTIAGKLVPSGCETMAIARERCGCKRTNEAVKSLIKRAQ